MVGQRRELSCNKVMSETCLVAEDIIFYASGSIVRTIKAFLHYTDCKVSLNPQCKAGRRTMIKSSAAFPNDSPSPLNY